MSKNFTKKILVIGSGGREHAICLAFKKSLTPNEIFVIPGNAGTAKIATNISDIALDDFNKIKNFCQENLIDFVFVGPEQPLTEGIVDYLQKNNIAVFGPNQKASQLEGSKIFMKKIARDFNIPTANYQDFYEPLSAIEYAKKLGFPCVIKTDGLASGKGVIIAENLDEAQKNINEIFAGKFGQAGKKIIIEEFLDGFEASYFVICDGKNFIPLGFAHDHKKVGEGETGLNTGGMGTYAPSPKINLQLEQKIIDSIIIPTLEGMTQIGCEYQGILFAGLMIKNQQPKLLEFNIRLGDPETQVLLPRIKSDFVELIECALAKKLNEFNIEFYDQKKLVCVVLCANGYPQDYQKGDEIKNLDKIENELLKNNDDSIEIIHAGTILRNDKIITNGGRILNIVAKANSFADARKKAYEVIDKIAFAQGFVRRDIAIKAIEE